MRTVYIDVLITVNLFIDFFLLLCTKTLLHIHTSIRRLIIGAAFGGSLSLIALLPALPAGINIAADVALSVPIVLIAFGRCEPKLIVKRTAAYFLCSFVFCGVMVLLYTSLKPKGMAVYNNVVYFNISPMLLIILTLAAYYVIKLTEKLTRGEIGKRVCEVKVFDKSGCAQFHAMVDTGCHVREPFSGRYVIIAEQELVRELSLSENTLRVIPFGSLNGSGVIRGYLPSRVLIDGSPTEELPYIGICENIMKGEVRAIIPRELAV